MNEPELRQGGGVYIYDWPDGVTAKVERLYENSHHEVHGQVTIKMGGTGHIHQARINLLSTSGRRQFSKFCQERYDLTAVDWDSKLEYICVKTLSLHREGEPVIDLADIEIDESMSWRIEPLLVEGQANLIYGTGGLGKSYLATYLGLLAIHGLTQCGLSAEPGVVLYLDYEADSQTAKRRADNLGRGLGIPYSHLLYRFSHQSVASSVQELQYIVAEKEVSLVIVDSAGPACGGEPETAANAISYFTALRSLKCTSLTIAHQSKNSRDGGPFGSVYWTNYPRQVYELKRHQEMDADEIIMSMVHRKVNDGRLQKPRGLKLKFGLDVTVEGHELMGVPQLATDMPAIDLICDAVRSGALTRGEIVAELTDVAETTIRQALKREKDRGLRSRIIQVGDRWGLRESP